MLPFEDNTFETVYFWLNIEKSFGEVKRVLKSGGTFLIGMESNGANNFIMKFWNRFIDMKLYTDEELIQLLELNDYSDITSYIRDGKKRQEIIKTNGNVKVADDDYSNFSVSDKFLERVTVTAKK